LFFSIACIADLVLRFFFIFCFCFPFQVLSQDGRSGALLIDSFLGDGADKDATPPVRVASGSFDTTPGRPRLAKTGFLGKKGQVNRQVSGGFVSENLFLHVSETLTFCPNMLCCSGSKDGSR
jgi:hypothetical protein